MMNFFSDPLRLDDLGDRTFRLVIDLTYSMDSGYTIIAPAGFLTDYASIPRAFWNILPPYGPYGKAAVIHDCLYRTKGFNGKYTRKQSDDIFLAGMKTMNVSWLTRHTMYRAVRTFSLRYWNRSEKKKINRLGILHSPKPTLIRV